MIECKPMTTLMASNLKLLIVSSSESVDAMMYHQMIRFLMYLMNTRLDICFVVNTLSQFIMDPRHVHLMVAKHAVRYLKGTVEYGLKYDTNRKIIWIRIGEEHFEVLLQYEIKCDLLV